MLATVPATAKVTKPALDPVEVYVQARAAEIAGDKRKAVGLLAAMAQANPSDQTIVRRAIATAIQSGDTEIAVRLAKTIPLDRQAFDSRLLLAADALKKERYSEAVSIVEKGTTNTEVELFAPIIKAWANTAEGNRSGVAALAKLPATSPLVPLANDHRALMLLALRSYDEASPLTKSAVQSSDVKLRLAIADGYMKGRRVDEAKSFLTGGSDTLAEARSRIDDGKSIGMAIDTPAKGMTSVLIALASDFVRDENKALPISLIQIALHSDPDNVSAQILLALLLDGDGRSDEAVSLLAKVPRNHLLASSARNTELAILTGNERYAEALRIAEPEARKADADSSSIRRYAEVLGDMERHSEAAAAYDRAIGRAAAEGDTRDIWTLHLLRAASLEEIERWPEARQELQSALKLEPENPILLNFLGYGKLERGEDIVAAEAMIRKASALRPDDASITDSLGWALYKTGKTNEAIATLRKAAAADAAESEIHEHLGDALYTSGRRIEARFAWSAALLTAKDKVKDRIQSKLDLGLNKTNAAP